MQFQELQMLLFLLLFLIVEKCKKNDVFVAQKGTLVDGHKFIDKAIQLGATSIICEEIPENKIEGITYVQVDNSDSALAIMAC